MMDENFWAQLFGKKPEERRVALKKRYLSKLHTDQKSKCMYCGTKIRDLDGEIDHKKPFSRDGSDQYRNLQLLCSNCNRRKGKLTDAQFKQKFKAILPDSLPPAREIPLKKFEDISSAVTARKAATAKRRRENDPFGFGF